MGDVPFATVAWREQELLLPQDGCHVLAVHDEQTVVVYQAFRREIADYAVADFGDTGATTRAGVFSFTRERAGN